jgi:hypothetical protein
MKKKKCYEKHFGYTIPKIYCKFCKKQIKTGENIYTVVLTWGDGRTACQECYDEYEVDWSLHAIEDLDNEDEDY